MRVRPFFWVMFCCVCAGVLVFAALAPSRVPALMRLSLMQRSAQSRLTTLAARVTDTQGLPIESAHLLVRAWMTNMDMTSEMSAHSTQQPGTYRVSMSLPMEGPWAFTVSMQADGFAAVQETLFVSVEASAPSERSSSTVSPPLD